MLEEGRRVFPNETRFVGGMATILYDLGRDNEAFEWEVRSRMLSGATEQDVQALRQTYARGGHRAGIRRDILAFEATPARTNPAGSLSRAYAAFGDGEQALKWLDESVSRHEDTILLVPTAVQYDFLRSDPRLKRILSRAGL